MSEATNYKYIRVGAGWVGDRGVSLSINVPLLSKLKQSDKGDVRLYMNTNDKKTEDKQPDYYLTVLNPDYVAS